MHLHSYSEKLSNALGEKKKKLSVFVWYTWTYFIISKVLFCLFNIHVLCTIVTFSNRSDFKFLGFFLWEPCEYCPKKDNPFPNTLVLLTTRKVEGWFKMIRNKSNFISWILGGKVKQGWHFCYIYCKYTDWPTNINWWTKWLKLRVTRLNLGETGFLTTYFMVISGHLVIRKWHHKKFYAHVYWSFAGLGNGKKSCIRYNQGTPTLIQKSHFMVYNCCCYYILPK